MLISIYADKAFAVDLVYWGCKETLSQQINPYSEEITPMGFTQPVDPVEGFNFKRASEEEKAGLTWTRVPTYSSTPLIIGPRYSMNSYIRIPKKGRYYFRLRSTQSGVSGLATVNVSPRLSTTSVKWTNVPFSNSMQLVYLPLGKQYTAFTQCAFPEDDRPIIFLELYLGNLIQNYSDKKAYQPSSIHKLGTKDVSIKGNSMYPMGVISVNNRISERPVSTYNLVYSSDDNLRMIDEPFQLADINFLRNPDSGDDGMDAQIIDNQLHIGNLKSNGVLFVYDLKGAVLANINLPSENFFTFPISELGITNHGVYIIKVACREDVKVMKYIK